MGRPPVAGGATQNRMMGKVRSNPYSSGSLVTQTAPTPKSSGRPVMMYVILVVLGVALVWIMRTHTSAQTGPALTLVSGGNPDQSTIDNLTNSINAIAGQVHQPAPAPGGGVGGHLVLVPKPQAFLTTQAVLGATGKSTSTGGA